MGSHAELPATQNKWKHPALIPAIKPVLGLPTPEGWKAELTYATRQCTGWESNLWPIHKSNALTTTPPGHNTYSLLTIQELLHIRKSPTELDYSVTFRLNALPVV